MLLMRALDSDGDWTFGKSKQNYIIEAIALKQSIATRVKSWKGNCFFSLTDFVDYDKYLDIGTQALLELELKKVISQTPGVLRINSFSSASSDRAFTFTCQVDTDYGIVSFTNEELA
jgi:hypothetical protein